MSWEQKRDLRGATWFGILRVGVTGCPPNTQDLCGPRMSGRWGCFGGVPEMRTQGSYTCLLLGSPRQTAASPWSWPCVLGHRPSVPSFCQMKAARNLLPRAAAGLGLHLFGLSRLPRDVPSVPLVALKHGVRELPHLLGELCGAEAVGTSWCGPKVSGAGETQWRTVLSRSTSSRNHGCRTRPPVSRQDSGETRRSGAWCFSGRLSGLETPRAKPESIDHIRVLSSFLQKLL